MLKQGSDFLFEISGYSRVNCTINVLSGKRLGSTLQYAAMRPKDAFEMANSIDSCFVISVCSELSCPKLRYLSATNT